MRLFKYTDGFAIQGYNWGVRVYWGIRKDWRWDIVCAKPENGGGFFSDLGWLILDVTW